ncbi:MAG TPA: MFS transporter [Ktedonobacteraceae bacterium]|nr:MFS transporter [Ktedonobacteraceae bacterium]
MFALLRQRNFALLWFSGLITTTGDWLLIIGLPVYIYTTTRSALATSVTLIVAVIPGLFLSSLAGVFVDRWDRRKTIIVTNFLLAAGLLPLLAVHSIDTLWIIYVVLFFESCVVQFSSPAENALLPLLVSEEQLVPANALNSISQNTSRLTGAALGGLLVGTLGLTSVVLLDMFSFLCVCVMLWLVRLPQELTRRQRVSDNVAVVEKNLLREWLEGMRLILHVRALTILFIMLALQFFGEGVFSVLLVVFVEKTLGYGAVVYGALNSMQAVGSILGGTAIGLVGKRFTPARLIGINTLVFGIIDLLIINVPLFLPSLLILLCLFILVGIPGTGMRVGINSLFQSLVEDSLRGRIFGAFSTVQSLMVLLGIGLAGALGGLLGAPLMLNIQGSVYALSGLFGLLTLGRMIGKKLEKQTSGLIV